MKKTVVAIRHGAQESLGSFTNAVAKAGFELREVVTPEATEAEWNAVRQAPVLIVMGGPMGVYDAGEFPFLKKELAILRERIKAGAPTLAICLGSQLLAQAAGAEVVKSGHQEIGWFPVELTSAGAADPLIGELDWSQPVFHWHGDTFPIPPGAAHLMTSERFAAQAFRLAPAIYGLQFHPEVTPSEYRFWIESDPTQPYGEIDGIQAKTAILDGGKRFGAGLESLAERLVTRFLGLIS